MFNKLYQKKDREIVSKIKAKHKIKSSSLCHRRIILIITAKWMMVLEILLEI